MKSLRNKVILSGIVLLFAFIATIGSTYAWFTVSSSTNVDAFQLEITAAENLMILVKDTSVTYDVDGDAAAQDLLFPGNYRAIISEQNLIDAGYLESEGVPHRLQPATVIDAGYNSFDAKTLSIIDLNSRNLTSTTTFNSSTGYAIKLEFFLFSQSEDPSVIELSSLGVNVTGLENTAGQEAVENAVRMSVWADDTVFWEDLNGAAGGTVGSANLYGLDDDYNYTFAGGAYDYTTNTSVTGDGNTLQEVADYYTGSLTLEADAEAAVLDVDIAAELAKDLFTIQPNTPTLITVLIFIEGWDAQTTNNITEALFEISFGFKFGTLDA